MANVSDPTNPNPAPDADLASFRLEKLKKIEALGIDPWGGRFDGHVAIEKIRELKAGSFDEPDLPVVRAAGRIVGRRGMGKVHFLELWDQTGKIQVMLGQKQIGDLGWQLANLLDRGDLIGVEGQFGRTKTGELTIRANGDKSLTILSKSLEPHPTNYYGMSDMEYRLRHRYLDLVYTPETLQRAKQRILILRTIRDYLNNIGFNEVETPTLHSIAGVRPPDPLRRIIMLWIFRYSSALLWNCT